VELLLTTGRVDVNYTKPGRGYFFEQRTALAAALYRGDAEGARLLLDAGACDASWSSSDATLLRALKAKQGALVRLLVERAGSNVRATGENGAICLHLAPDAETCRLLLDRGAGDEGRINSVTGDKGQTALHLAVDAGVAIALLGAGSDPGIRDLKGRMALHCAKDGPVARALLDAGVDPGVRDSEGRTALLRATSLWDHSVAEALLERGAQEVDVPAATGGRR
jgi:ankyrin repeat protein